MKRKFILLPITLTALSPMVSMVGCGNSDTPTPEPPDSKDYLTFEALEDGQMSCDITVGHGEPEVNLNVQYSLNDGEWTKLDVNIYENIHYLQYKVGDTIRLKGINDYWSFLGEYDTEYCEIFSSLHFTGLVNVSGNIMSLLYSDDFVDKTIIPCDGCFASIFDGFVSEELNFAQIKDASNLILPSDTLTAGCYSGMFNFCENLISAPTLPATTLTTYCYKNMFENCDSLVTAPALPASTLAESCYENMFDNCDRLISAPALPATTLADYCYAKMFFNCNSLANAPMLRAEELAEGCYSSMFRNCTSLIVNTEGDPDHLIFNCPETQGLDRPIDGMFAGTKGTHDDTPVPGTSYYWAE